MNLKNMDQITRDNFLKNELSEEKVLMIEKFHLESSPDLYWVSRRENSHEQIFFKHSFIKNSTILLILFRINKLCFGKVKYFSENINDFEPMFYDYRLGFQTTELWNADFLQHKKSGFIIDLRSLARITEIEKFKEFCRTLEE